MLNKYLFIFLILCSTSLSSTFDTGMKTFGGSFGFYQDLNADVTVLNVSPRFGYFVNQYLMFELGMTYVKIDIENYNPNTYEGGYSSGDQNTTSLGGRIFLNKFYAGFEFVKGFTASKSTGLGNDFTYNTLNFDGATERGLFKIGILSPIGDQLFLDSAFHYMFILDKDEREIAASNHDEFTQLAYVTLGITYFWTPKRQEQ